jgi:proteic killer suppression protein
VSGCDIACVLFLELGKVIKNFLHKGLKTFYETGKTSGIQATHQRKLQLILTRLDSIHVPEDMNLPGFDFHPLRGDMKDFYAIRACRQFYYAGHNTPIFCAPLLTYNNICCATVLKNQRILPQPSELTAGPSVNKNWRVVFRFDGVDVYAVDYTDYH